MTQFPCPRCRTTIGPTAERVGSQIKCPQCGCLVHFPGVVAAKAKAPVSRRMTLLLMCGLGALAAMCAGGLLIGGMGLDELLTRFRQPAIDAASDKDDLGKDASARPETPADNGAAKPSDNAPAKAPDMAPDEPRVDADLQKKINAAIDKGIVFLKKAQIDGDNNSDIVRGLRALIAWTLLESGVPARDPAVQTLVQQVRRDNIRGDNHYTYTLGLEILLLDKLGDPSDVPLIHSAAVRLLGGQNAFGGWSYHCPGLSIAEASRLAKYLDQIEGQKTTVEARPVPEIDEQLKAILTTKPQDQSYGDNSNTQFGIMGLWAARRHHIPARRALNWSAQRFLLTRHIDGMWGYHPFSPGDAGHNVVGNRTSTCIGLYALATDAGLKNKTGKRVDLMTDPLIRKTFKALAADLETDVPTHPYERMSYYLYALEKTAEVFNLKMIGGKDWYRWGAEWLVKAQLHDGSWDAARGEQAGDAANVEPIDTCFALLFLKRVNPAPDLAMNLRGIRVPPVEEHPLDLPKTIRDLRKAKSP